MTVTLLHGDCLDGLRAMADNAVDCVVVDPPYGIGKHNIVPYARTERNSKGRITNDFAWDEQRLDRPYIDEMLRISNNQVIWGGNYYTDKLPPSRCWLVWDKQNSGNFADFELAWTSYDRASEMYRYMWNGMIKQMPEERFHPTQKPLSLMIWVLENYTKPGDLVCDPCAGSATTAIAAIKTGRRFVGWEKDATYHARASQRIADAQAQPSLFEVA